MTASYSVQARLASGLSRVNDQSLSSVESSNLETVTIASLAGSENTFNFHRFRAWDKRPSVEDAYFAVFG